MVSAETASADPRLAVVVTNYNYGRFVGAAVDSALAQDDVEVIVVDDGSSDDSVAVLHSYGHRIQLIVQPNGGQAAAFNAGFARVTAPIVVFLDADDVLARGMTARLDAAFSNPAVGKVQFPLTLIDESGVALPGSMPSDPARLARGDVRPRLLIGPDDLAWQPTSGNAFRRTVLEQILPMPSAPYRICADYYLSNLTAAHGPVVVLDSPGGSYRVHGENNHFAEQTTLDALRQNVVRTRETNRLLLEHCRQLGLPGSGIEPSELRSVTALGHRLVSVRLDSQRHPIEGETRWGIVRAGVEASVLRRDLNPLRRAATALWFLLIGAVPRRTVTSFATPLVRVVGGRDVKRTSVAGTLPVAGRLDWLTLLPFDDSVQRVVLLGDATDEEAAGIARHFGVAHVERDLSCGNVDVLVVRDIQQVRQALGMLAPSGVAWVESPSRWARLMRTADRAAKKAGHHVRARYWVLPTAHRARRYVPVDHRDALRWYLDELFVARTIPQRIARRAMSWLPGLAILSGGGCATVVSGPMARSGLLVGERNTGVPRDTAVMLQCGGHDLGNRTIVIPFGPAGPTGSLLKVAASPEMGDLVDAEFRVLQDLHATLPAAIAADIPVPQARWLWAKRVVTEESRFLGPTIDQAMGAGRVPKDAALRLVADWIARFHTATATESKWSRDRFDRVILPTFEAFRAAYGATEQIEQLFQRAESASSRLSGARLVEVRRHWDLTPTNVIMANDGLGVIDWEPGIGRPTDGRGLPVCDLDYFAKFWLHAVGHPSSEADQAALFPHVSSTLTALTRDVLVNYCDVMGIEPDFVPMITAYHWTEQAVHDFARGRRLGGMPAERFAAAGHVGALAAAQDELFEVWSM